MIYALDGTFSCSFFFWAFFFSNQSSMTLFDALSHATNNVNANHCNNMEGSNINNSNSEVFPSWYQAFSTMSSTELLSAFMPPTSFSAVKVSPSLGIVEILCDI
jgi:hypothetical protein